MLPRLGVYAPELGAYATGLGVYATFVSPRGSFDPFFSVCYSIFSVKHLYIKIVEQL